MNVSNCMQRSWLTGLNVTYFCYYHDFRFWKTCIKVINLGKVWIWGISYLSYLSYRWHWKYFVPGWPSASRKMTERGVWKYVCVLLKCYFLVCLFRLPMMILRKPTVVHLLSMDIILQVLQGTSPQVVVLISLGLGAAFQECYSVNVYCITSQKTYQVSQFLEIVLVCWLLSQCIGNFWYSLDMYQFFNILLLCIITLNV